MSYDQLLLCFAPELTAQDSEEEKRFALSETINCLWQNFVLRVAEVGYLSVYVS